MCVGWEKWLRPENRGSWSGLGVLSLSWAEGQPDCEVPRAGLGRRESEGIKWRRSNWVYAVSHLIYQ